MIVAAPPDNSPLGLNAQIFYDSEVTDPTKAADALVAGVLRLPGGRILSQETVKIEGDTPAAQVVYALGRGDQEARGVLTVATRGTQIVTVVFIAPVAAFQQQQEQYLAMLRRLRLEEPRPFGISRSEAVTLFYPGPATLDPALATEVTSVQYIMQLFGGLVALDPQLKVVPDLAERWEVNPAGTVYTFFLRANARFHDGRQVTAQDVKYSWERTAKSPSTTAPTYLGDIVGVKDVVDKKAQSISGVEVVDARTLRVTIDAPKSYFLSKLTHPAAFVVDKANVEVATQPWWVKPNGTGPFRLKGWMPDVSLALEANKSYHRELARVAYVVFQQVGASPLQLYQTGETDVAFLGLDEIDEVQAAGKPLTDQLKETAQLSISFVGFNVTRPPFDDPLVRRAFLLAADRVRLVKEVFRDREEVAQGILPPGLPAYNRQIAPIPFDPAQARQLLSQSRYAQAMPEITFITAGRTQASPVIEALVKMWQENLGVRVGVQLLEPEQYYYLLPSVGGNLYNYSWIADYPDPENFLDALFHSKVPNNPGQFSSQLVDQLLEKARTEPDPEARVRLYRQAEEALMNEAAAVPLTFGSEFYLVKARVQGLVVTPQGLVELRLVSLAPATR
ncbi:MAG: peptide ABC transporter substrate-binding protein [Chloroflexi bacterium]|nr:peptide ABC transporter substrate-binding protein [Chloroflexota bacterium]